MPLPTPFHSRTAPLCTSMLWKEWGGYLAVRSYTGYPMAEYYALRQSVGLIDVTPLFKYDVEGPDAERFLSRTTVRDVSRLRPGRVTYLCWCDDDGKVIDDGTLSRFDQERFLLTAAEPSLGWLMPLSRGYRVSIEDVSDSLAALAVQGPSSRQLLAALSSRPIDELRYFGTLETQIAGHRVRLSRTGYTGDLGYEVWVARDDAEAVYDALYETGQQYDLLPCGLDALDIARIEAGYIMNGVDYYSAHHCLIEARKSSPYELGLGFTVALDRDPFVGQEALRRLQGATPKRCLVGLEVDWDELEKLFSSYGLPPKVPQAAWRDGRPVYDLDENWIGQATSGAWSPLLKKDLALAQIDPAFATPGERLGFEITAEYRRHIISATVRETPFFDPERKRS